MKNIREVEYMKKLTIEMACSINGLIATEDGMEFPMLYTVIQ